MRNFEDPPYFERTGCSRDCECRSYTSHLNTVSEERSQSSMTSEEIIRRLARRTVKEDVTFDDKLDSLTVGLRHERSGEQRLKSLRFWRFEETINSEFRIGKLFLYPYQQDRYHRIFRQTVFCRHKAYSYFCRIQTSVYMSLHLSKLHLHMSQLKN